jgi:hypothetical protein
VRCSGEWAYFSRLRTLLGHADGFQPLIVNKAIQLRVLAFLLKSSFGTQQVHEDGCIKRLCIPRAIYIQIKGVLQQTCSKLEKELLNFLQQSMFDPKRRNVEALPSFFVTVALLSTYSILGTCFIVCQPFSSPYPRGTVLIESSIRAAKCMVNGRFWTP